MFNEKIEMYNRVLILIMRSHRVTNRLVNVMLHDHNINIVNRILIIFKAFYKKLVSSISTITVVPIDIFMASKRHLVEIRKEFAQMDAEISELERELNAIR